MSNPYRGKPAYQFWQSAVASPPALAVDPLVTSGFKISPHDRVATAGSCFAQHIARRLAASGYDYMVAEAAPAFPFTENENYGTFSARYGNIYTTRQLLQLFRRAYATFAPTETAWQRDDGRYVDPFRPHIQAGGFATIAELLADREAHLAAVREMFETCDVFVFTLGMTEGWTALADGAVFPLAPGTVTSRIDPAAYAFHNFTVAEMEADLAQFVGFLQRINPAVRIVLTVSPVAMIATYEPRHVLVSTSYTKAALRVVADMIARRFARVDYFPSYEMITGPHTRGAFYAEDLRQVLPEGVDYVMAAFARHYLRDEARPPEPVAAGAAALQEAIRTQVAAMAAVAKIVCDEETIVREMA